MEKEKIKKIFEFLEEKGEHNMPVKWKLINNIPLKKEELNIEGSLDLAFSEITSLPEGLKVRGTLRLGFTNIASLPKGLKVGGELELRNTLITSLPKGLEVLDWLYISNTELEKYTDEELREMIKPGFIKGKIVR